MLCELDQAPADYGTCLTGIAGIVRIAAATIIAIVVDVRRFTTPGPFASFTGTAPVAASSGDKSATASTGVGTGR